MLPRPSLLFVALRSPRKVCYRFHAPCGVVSRSFVTELALEEDDELVLIKLPPGFDLKQLHKTQVSLPKRKEQVTVAVAGGEQALLRPLDGSYLDQVRLLACNEEGTLEPQMLDRGFEVVRLTEQVDVSARNRIVAEAKRQVAPPKRTRPPPMELARKLPIGFVEQEEASKPTPSKKSKVRKEESQKKKKKKKKKDRKKT